MTIIRKSTNPTLDVQVLAPTFFLQRKLGGPAGRAINPLSIKRAETALQHLIPPIDDEVRRLLSELQAAVIGADENARTIIWNHAHEIRGLAGTAHKIRLGQAADIICRYLFGTEPSFKPDPAVLSTIAIVAIMAVKDGADDDAMVEKLLDDGLRAVNVQRHREGRDAV